MAKRKVHTTKDELRQSFFSSKVSSFWWLGAVLLLAGALYAGYTLSASSRVSQIEFSGIHFEDKRELEKMLPPVENRYIDSLDYLRLIYTLEQRAYVKEAAVSIEHNGTLHFMITERRPLALAVNGRNKFYVDEDGVLLPVILTKAVEVPLLYGLNAKAAGDTLQSSSFLMARKFLVEMQNNLMYRATISEISVSLEEGITALSHDQGVPILFGKTQFRQKLKSWQAFYKQVVVHKGMKRFKYIDFRFDGQIVTKQS